MSNLTENIEKALSVQQSIYKQFEEQIKILTALKEIYQVISKDEDTDLSTIELKELVKQTEQSAVETGIFRLAAKYPQLNQVEYEIGKLEELQNKWATISEKLTS